MDWYYAQGGTRVGPVSESEFEATVRAGVVGPDTLVWHAGMAEWQSYDTLPRPVEAAPDQAPLTCSRCGGSFSAEDLVRFGETYICAACKPYFAQQLRESGLPSGSMRFGGFWIRFAARIIDWVLLYICELPLSIAFSHRINPATMNLVSMLQTQGLLILIQTMIALAYEVIMVTRWGGTVGKLALGLRIVTPDGRFLSVGRAIGRHFAQWLSGFTLLIGYIIAGFDDQKRSLHDRICDTRVIRK